MNAQVSATNQSNSQEQLMDTQDTPTGGTKQKQQQQQQQPQSQQQHQQPHQQHQHQQRSSSSFITLDGIRPYDVLCGRNKTSYNNIGNRRFRILINLNLPHYLECKSRNERSRMILKLTRDLCCCSDESQIVDKLPSPNSCVRFFKRQKGVNELIELDFKGCREKIGHALRDAAAQHNNNISSNKSKEAIYEKTTNQQQQQKEEEAIVALTNLNSNYSENFFPNFDNNNGNSNNTNSNGIHRDSIVSSGTPRNWSRYSMEILHSLREEAVPNISSLFFNNAIDYNHCKDDSGSHQQQSNNFTGDGINPVMSDIEPLAV